MSTLVSYAPASVYQEVGRRSEIEGASPHRLIELLLEGAITNIAKACSAIEHRDIEARGLWINKSIDIIAELRSSLDVDIGGEMAENLYRLYQYMELTLAEAHLNADTEALDGISRLLNDLLVTWQEIKGELL